MSSSCEHGQPNSGYNCVACNRKRVTELEATIAELKEAMTGWEGYAHKDGEYVDDIGEYFTALLKEKNDE